MSIPDIEVSDLATFKGKPEEMFGFFAPEAIAQATFLIQELAGIEDVDENNIRFTKLFKYAVLELAYELYIEQEYSDISVNPFSSETIGSYSYSKSQKAQAAMNNAGADLMWLGRLKDFLSNQNADANSIQYGGVIGFENDGAELLPNGDRRILSPRYDSRYYTRGQSIDPMF